MEKVIVYIDAHNLYRAHMDYGIARVDVKKLVQNIVGRNKRLIRAYYYVALADRNLDPIAHDRKSKFVEFINRQERMEVKLGKLKVETRKVSKNILETIKKACQDKTLPREAISKLASLETSLRGFLIDDAIEIKEKGIDVQIAVDMIKDANKKISDVQILVSGDADFIHLLKNLKEIGQVVGVVSSRGNASSELINHADFHKLLDKSDFKKLSLK
ncbi:hypothetical protein CL645_03170 [bacterium]|nr:hypothetical protein [bacterium]|tara:strand:+ start:902 stop:1549 length:648 start_codon:yes stop_codon:yes gene_type:complete